MAVGIRIKFAGLAQEQFDAVNAQVDPAGDPPKGLMFHASGPIEGGWGVIDFWESREAFDHFVQTRLGPTARELGDKAPSSPPDVKEFSVHHFVKP
jgi:hypothetical protein